MFEKKMTPNLPKRETPKAKYDAAKVLPLNQLVAELFYPTRE